MCGTGTGYTEVTNPHTSTSRHVKGFVENRHDIKLRPELRLKSNFWKAFPTNLKQNYNEVVNSGSYHSTYTSYEIFTMQE